MAVQIFLPRYGEVIARDQLPTLDLPVSGTQNATSDIDMKPICLVRPSPLPAFSTYSQTGRDSSTIHQAQEHSSASCLLDAVEPKWQATGSEMAGLSPFRSKIYTRCTGSSSELSYSSCEHLPVTPDPSFLTSTLCCSIGMAGVQATVTNLSADNATDGTSIKGSDAARLMVRQKK
jgi:hypothetical protein